MELTARVQLVKERLEAAALRSGRTSADVTLVAVSKTRSIEEVAAAAALGLRHFGENYVQELTAKQEALVGEGLGLEWHFIGHLQRNKVRFLTPFCALLEVVDSVRLAEEISRRAAGDGRVQPVLLQVDLAGEETKFGCPEGDVAPLAEALAGLPNLYWQGLMAIPPAAAEAEASRPFYRRLAALRDRLIAEGHCPAHLRHLSMGMSSDYEVAIEEGATLVRIGTAIFGPRA